MIFEQATEGLPDLTIDYEIQTMLDAGRAVVSPPLDEIPLAQFRSGYRQKYSERSVEAQEPVGHQSIVLPGPENISLRVFRPTRLVGTAPAIIYLHGGGFVLGDGDAYARQSARVASLCGAVVIFVDYRLAPENPFPAAQEDVLRATEHVLERHGALGIDPARISLMGDSAGCENAPNSAPSSTRINPLISLRK